NPRYLPEFSGKDPTALSEPPFVPPPTMDLGSHIVQTRPASQMRPPEVSTSLALGDDRELQLRNLNESEDEKLYTSQLVTDTTLYGTMVDGARNLSSRSQSTYYEQNIRYDLYSTRLDGHYLSLQLDSTYCNDDREYADAFTLNQLSLESKTPHSRLVFGHAYPEFSRFSMSQQMVGLYGTQKFSHTEAKAFTGYRSITNDALRNPRLVSGFRLQHDSDESFTMGLNAVGTRDRHESPGSSDDLPTLRNKVYSFDCLLKPNENWSFEAEVARSDTDFDQRSEAGNQYANAYRAQGTWTRENAQLQGGIEQADTAFLTMLGESLRDQRAYYGRFFYELNEYVSGRVATRLTRDNLDNYKRATLIRNEPEVQLTFKPSEYYRDLRFEFFYQPLHEYSDNGDFLDRYRDLTWLEMHQKAGAMRYYTGLAWTIDKDKIDRTNDRDTTKFDLKATWEYDAHRQLYGLLGIEQYALKTVGGKDITKTIGLGGRSLFHEDITLDLDYLHEISDVKARQLDSIHDRLTFSVTKEYNNYARFIVSVEGTRHQFDMSDQDYSDVAAKVRLLRFF
ncbi:MAG TPA: hypothetical protein PKO06_01635, partial [Candidatus Ozemobacteraceae bacterium]|nr:hypothetical protein [Candidatus Ozemobacteraceae bacterium]